jgi:hypothetical protein
MRRRWQAEKLKLSESPTNTLAPRASNVVLQPARWPQPKGYANGIKARGEMSAKLHHHSSLASINRFALAGYPF